MPDPVLEATASNLIEYYRNPRLGRMALVFKKLRKADDATTAADIAASREQRIGRAPSVRGSLLLVRRQQHRSSIESAGTQSVKRVVGGSQSERRRMHLNWMLRRQC